MSKKLFFLLSLFVTVQCSVKIDKSQELKLTQKPLNLITNILMTLN